jgi:hypothetical protein
MHPDAVRHGHVGRGRLMFGQSQVNRQKRYHHVYCELIISHGRRFLVHVRKETQQQKRNVGRHKDQLSLEKDQIESGALSFHPIQGILSRNRPMTTEATSQPGTIVFVFIQVNLCPSGERRGKQGTNLGRVSLRGTRRCHGLKNTPNVIVEIITNQEDEPSCSGPKPSKRLRLRRNAVRNIRATACFGIFQDTEAKPTAT